METVAHLENIALKIIMFIMYGSIKHYKSKETPIKV